MNRENVSVLVCTYNPIKEKLHKTLNSILMQEDVDLQIVISDDGSKNNLFDFAREYFREHNFSNYKLVAFEENHGTTMNVIQGLEACSGFYVKPFSPGDLLIGKNCLSEWAKHLKNSSKKWSFGDAVYYKPFVDDDLKICSQIAHPQRIKVYKNQDDKQCRWNYVVLSDITNGATTLVEKDIFLQYIKKLDDNVIYAEDNSYRLMMFDGIVADYYPKNVVLYEYSTGISTCGNSVWKERVKKDWEASDEIMFADVSAMDDFQIKMMNAYLAIKSRSQKSLCCKLKNITVKDCLKIKLKQHFYPRMTPTYFNADE